jgi:ribokinase
VIVVVGTPAWRESEPQGPDGRACRIALSAARAGASVELIGRAGDDPAGDRLMIALTQAGVGHVALLRDPARPTPIVEMAPAEESSVADERAEPNAPVVPQQDRPVLEPADVALGLRYLPSYEVIVVTDDVRPDAIPVAAEAAAFAGAQLVVLVRAGPGRDVGPDAATVLEAPATDPDGAFAELVGAYAAALDGGAKPADAFAAARGAFWD